MGKYIMPTFNSNDIKNEIIPNIVKHLKECLFSRTYDSDKKQVGYSNEELNNLDNQNRLNVLNSLKTLINDIYIKDENTENNHLSMSKDELSQAIKGLQGEIEYGFWVKLGHGFSDVGCKKDSRLHQGLDDLLNNLEGVYKLDTNDMNEARLNKTIENQTSKLEIQTKSITELEIGYKKETEKYSKLEVTLNGMENKLNDLQSKISPFEKQMPDIEESTSKLNESTQKLSEANQLILLQRDSINKFAKKISTQSNEKIELNNKLHSKTEFISKISSRLKESESIPSYEHIDESRKYKYDIEMSSATFKEMNKLKFEEMNKLKEESIPKSLTTKI